ncbi:FecR family protein [Chitinophagaceae bacterium LWZ2-11]
MSINWDILIKALQHSISPEEKILLENWLDESAEHRRLWHELQIQQASLNTLVTEEEMANEWQQLQLRLLDEAPVKQLFGSRLLKSVAAIAAVFIVFFLSKSFIQPNKRNAMTGIVKINAPKDARRKVILPDGSIVWLHYGASLQFDSLSFNKEKREIEFSGDAFFDIAKNKQKPFVINTAFLRVGVVGTSFGVYTTDKETQAVKVATGVVNVTSGNTVNQLLPGNALSYNTITRQVLRSNIDITDADALKENKLFFEKDSLISIAYKLRNWYHKNVTIQGVIQKRVSFTGVVPANNMDTVLMGLSYVAGFTYKVNDNEIIIYPQH